MPERTVGTYSSTIHFNEGISTTTYLENEAVKPNIVIWDKREEVAIFVSVPNDAGEGKDSKILRSYV